jgi:hypothetical protein
LPGGFGLGFGYLRIAEFLQGVGFVLGVWQKRAQGG